MQEQAAYDKKGFLAYIKGYIQKLTPLLPADRQAQFKTDVQAAVKHLLGKLSDLQLWDPASIQTVDLPICAVLGGTRGKEDDAQATVAHFLNLKLPPSVLWNISALAILLPCTMHPL